MLKPHPRVQNDECMLADQCVGIFTCVLLFAGGFDRGGFKHSGIGRELGPGAIRACCEPQSILTAHNVP